MGTLETTEYRNYPMPVEDNTLAEDVLTLRLALEMVDGDVNALLAALSGKAASVHAHTIAQIDGLASALAGKADGDHDHTLGGLSNVLAAVDGAAAGTVLYKTASGWNAGNPAVILGSHQHVIGNVEGLEAALNAKLETSSLPGAFSGVTAKTTINDSDAFVGTDAEASNVAKRFSWATIKSTLQSLFDGRYFRSSNNLSEVANAAAARANLGMAAFSPVCKFVLDWNDAVDNGFYMSSIEAANSPKASWFMGVVYVHNELWITQEVHEFSADSPSSGPVVRWVREKNNGVWSSWRRFVLGNVTFSTAAPSGGVDGDIWFRYA